jgi:hypothetical protein
MLEEMYLCYDRDGLVFGLSDAHRHGRVSFFHGHLGLDEKFNRGAENQIAPPR